MHRVPLSNFDTLLISVYLKVYLQQYGQFRYQPCRSPSSPPGRSCREATEGSLRFFGSPNIVSVCIASGGVLFCTDRKVPKRAARRGIPHFPLRDLPLKAAQGGALCPSLRILRAAQKIEKLLSPNFAAGDERRWTGRVLDAPLPARFRFGSVIVTLTPIRHWPVPRGNLGRMYTVYHHVVPPERSKTVPYMGER